MNDCDCVATEEYEATDAEGTPLDSKGRPKVRTADKSRQRVCEALIKELYAQVNGKQCPWGKPEGKQLAVFINRTTGWTLPDLDKCIKNRFNSEVNHAEAPSKWLPRLEAYLNGSLDKYGKPQAAIANAARRATLAEQVAERLRRNNH